MGSATQTNITPTVEMDSDEAFGAAVALASESGIVPNDIQNGCLEERIVRKKIG